MPGMGGVPAMIGHYGLCRQKQHVHDSFHPPIQVQHSIKWSNIAIGGPAAPSQGVSVEAGPERVEVTCWAMNRLV